MGFIDVLNSVLEEKKSSVANLPKLIEEAKEAIRTAGFNDVRENYDLKLARERRMLYSKKLKTDSNWVMECEDYLSKYSDDSSDNSKPETITIGTEIGVTVTDPSGVEINQTLYIVPKAISHSPRGLLSDTCAAGKALMGRRAGDIVDVVVGVSTVKYRINSIS